MEGIYDVMLWDKPVGKATVSREGLYYRFQCRCALAESTICRIYAGKESLGILVPLGNGYGLDTKLPMKRFVGGIPEFRLVPNKPLLEGKFVPIKPEEPFTYIERLKEAYLAQRDGQVGVILKEAGT